MTARVSTSFSRVVPPCLAAFFGMHSSIVKRAACQSPVRYWAKASVNSGRIPRSIEADPSLPRSPA